jgi:hypothetical protein
MLRACSLQYGRSWDKSLLYTNFSYNNSNQESLKMTPFEMLYGQRCRIPLFWSETGERKVFEPDMLQEAKKQIRMVRENLRVAQLRQKSYANHMRRELSFEVRDFVYLKVSPMRGLHHSRFEESSHQGSLDHSRFWRREVKWLTNWNCRRSCLTCMTCCMYLS